jgi:hypothetical protein
LAAFLKKQRSVLVFDGLRVHQCPKVATLSISHACCYHNNYRGALPEEEGPEYRFMAVRHPLDRIVSAWAFFCTGDDGDIKDQPDFLALGYAFGMPFEAFLEICLERHVSNGHTRMQSAFAGPHKIDFMCPLSRLHEGWEGLRSVFPSLRSLGHRHKTKRAAWQDYFTPETQALAENVFSEDLARFEMSLRQFDATIEILRSK